MLQERGLEFVYTTPLYSTDNWNFCFMQDVCNAYKDRRFTLHLYYIDQFRNETMIVWQKCIFFPLYVSILLHLKYRAFVSSYPSTCSKNRLSVWVCVKPEWFATLIACYKSRTNESLTMRATTGHEASVRLYAHTLKHIYTSVWKCRVIRNEACL